LIYGQIITQRCPEKIAQSLKQPHFATVCSRITRGFHQNAQKRSLLVNAKFVSLR